VNQNMARAKNIANADELREQVHAMLLPDWVSIAAVAFAIPVSPDDLERWLAGNPIKADQVRFEKEIAAYLEKRAAWLADVKKADLNGRRELRLAKALEIGRLSEKFEDEPAHSPYRGLLRESVLFGLCDLLSVFDDEVCFRCGASRPAATVEAQIEIWKRNAAWAGWENFPDQMRAVMVDGERIMAVNPGRVWIRRPDGSVYCVLRGAPVNGGGIEEISR
jgi:hypothetical protein